jgi:crotonobetainyl-CoA:carnitine CoA-transferase CaiB-like acyl-CoA transferase
MNDNIFSGLKVVDFASFIAGPSAAVILSDFGAEVIKVEPPSGDMWRIGHKIPPQPQAMDPYPFHLANRNKRGLSLDLKSPSARQVLERLVKWADVLIVNTPHPARKRLKLEYDDLVDWNPRLIYADVGASRIRHHGVLGAQWLVVDDSRRRRAADLAGRRQRGQRHCRRPVWRDCDGALSA